MMKQILKEDQKKNQTIIFNSWIVWRDLCAARYLSSLSCLPEMACWAVSSRRVVDRRYSVDWLTYL